MHEHTRRYGVPVHGVRKGAPCGPQAQDDSSFARAMSSRVGGFMPIGGGSPLATESELEDLRKEITRLENEAAADRAKADQRVAEIREAGTDPLKDKAAFEELDGLYKVSDGKLQEASELRERADRAMQTLGRDAPSKPERRDNGRPDAAASLADAFIESDVYKRVQELAPTDLRAAAAHLQNNPVELASRDESVARLRGVTMPASPSAAIPADFLAPVPGLQEMIRVLQLITTLPTDSDTVEFVREILTDTAAAETAYGTALPESAFEFESISQTLKRIGHWTPVTEAQLADAAFLRGYLNQRLVEDVRRKTEERVISGDTVADPAQWNGILNTTGIGSVALGTDTVLDATHKAITACRLAHVEPNGIGFHPSDYESGVVLAKDGQGNYMFKIGEPTSVWGKPTAVSTAFPQGTALVGAFEFAVLVVRNAIQVLASTEHASFFLEGRVALKAEYRAGFFVTRPAAFTEVTGIPA